MGHDTQEQIEQDLDADDILLELAEIETIIEALEVAILYEEEETIIQETKTIIEALQASKNILNEFAKNC